VRSFSKEFVVGAMHVPAGKLGCTVRQTYMILQSIFSNACT
jgi:hypothetical protein